MKISEQLLIEEVRQFAQKLIGICRGLSTGRLLRMIRLQLGMTQKTLSIKSGVPQSTISRIEKGTKDVNMSTLNRIAQALSCDLIIIPKLKEPIDSIRGRQAHKKANSHIQYIKGTMSLEGQEPDEKFMENLLKQEEHKLLYDSGFELWEE